MKQAVVFFVLFFFMPVLLFSQNKDSSFIKQDTAKSLINKDSLLKDSGIVSGNIIYKNKLDSFLEKNNLLNFKSPPVALTAHEKKAGNRQTIYFYFITVMVLFLAFFKFFYARYFNNLFRVFFNTSLRQSQLTDQLLQAKQPSLFFNVFFVFAGGIYVYFLLYHFNWLGRVGILFNIMACILSISIIYFLKYIVLKFTGWLTGNKETTNTYIFIVFLINKILGIFLLPFVIILAFSDQILVTPAILISLILVGLMLLLRFIRSYGLLQNRLKVSQFHFLLYVAGIEIIPLLLIYKALMILLNKNL